MIIKEYYANINIHKPKNYFENWYTDVWRRRIEKFAVSPSELTNILKEELNLLGAKLSYNEKGLRFRVEFLDHHKYTIFVLKWI
jgi:hypothetical protein